jgi:hypothetical protein
MQRLAHEFNGATLVHYDSPFGDGYALCGQDIIGDEVGGDSWTEAKQTNRRVNCADCRAIVDHVRGRAPSAGREKQNGG